MFFNFLQVKEILFCPSVSEYNLLIMKTACVVGANYMKGIWISVKSPYINRIITYEKLIETPESYRFFRSKKGRKYVEYPKSTLILFEERDKDKIQTLYNAEIIKEKIDKFVSLLQKKIELELRKKITPILDKLKKKKMELLRLQNNIKILIEKEGILRKRPSKNLIGYYAFFFHDNGEIKYKFIENENILQELKECEFVVLPKEKGQKIALLLDKLKSKLEKIEELLDKIYKNLKEKEREILKNRLKKIFSELGNIEVKDDYVDPNIPLIVIKDIESLKSIKKFLDLQEEKRREKERESLKKLLNNDF